jgi:hypothetical protein
MKNAIYTTFHDGTGKVYNYHTSVWQETETASCRFQLLEFPYTLNGIAGAAIDSAACGAVISVTFLAVGNPVYILWAKSTSTVVTAAVASDGAYTAFAPSTYWSYLQRFWDNGWDNSWSLQRYAGPASNADYLTWDAANASAYLNNSILGMNPLIQPDAEWWVYIAPDGKLRTINNYYTPLSYVEFGNLGYNNPNYFLYYYFHFRRGPTDPAYADEFPAFLRENVVIYTVKFAGESLTDGYVVKTWRPDAQASGPDVFYTVMPGSVDVDNWTAIVSGYDTVNGHPVPPVNPYPPATPGTPSAPSGPWVPPAPPITAETTFLCGGSWSELATAPAPFALGGSLAEVATAPAPFTTGGSTLERMAPNALPVVPGLPQPSGSMKERMCLPFKIGG